MTTTLDLAKQIANMQTDLLVVFENNEIILTNSALNKFFGVSSIEEYKSSFGEFVNHFVPHPSYFNAEKVNEGETWFESIQALNEIDRVVSILDQTFKGHAFSVRIDSSLDNQKIVTFTDITQSLIQRIMIENNANIDKHSGAYTKQYFLQITSSFEEAASFNKKIIGLTLIDIEESDEINHENTQELVRYFKGFIRQDDMLVKYSDTKFLLAFLVDDAQKVQQVTSKLNIMLQKHKVDGFSFKLSTKYQEKNEKLNALISKVLEN
ncbi:MAG TPA: GGDEF domain-containing protein [Sulfurimonas sp.]|nr:GGDEF domain-containing protein [Sulfurimonas sp.]